MEYNNEFLEQYISYVEVTYATLETTYKDIFSKKIYTFEEVKTTLSNIFEDYLNIVKYMEFCKANDEFFTHNTENSMQVLNEAMSCYEAENLVLLCDYLYYGLSNELMVIFKAIDSKLA